MRRNCSSSCFSHMLRHLDRVEVGELDHGRGERLVVLLLHVELVERVVHLLDVLRLRREQVGLDERQVARLAQLLHDAHVVDSLRHRRTAGR